MNAPSYLPFKIHVFLPNIYIYVFTYTLMNEIGTDMHIQM